MSVLRIGALPPAVVGGAEKRSREQDHAPAGNLYFIPAGFEVTHSVDPTAGVAVASEKNRLKKRARAFGLTYRKVPGDGACQFNAISDQMRGAFSPSQLRAMVCDFIGAHRAAYDGFNDAVDEGSFDEGLAKLREPYEYGNALTLTAAATMFGRDICILQSSASQLWQVVTPTPGVQPSVPGTGTRPIWLAFTPEHHYDSLYSVEALR